MEPGILTFETWKVYSQTLFFQHKGLGLEPTHNEGVVSLGFSLSARFLSPPLLPTANTHFFCRFFGDRWRPCGERTWQPLEVDLLTQVQLLHTCAIPGAGF